MNPVNDESQTDDENSSIIDDAKDDIENDQKQSAVLPGEDVKDEDLNKDDELKLEDDDNKIKIDDDEEEEELAAKLPKKPLW